jgi:hypothetical protein
MKAKDYTTILRAIEQALEVCDNSTGFMDEMHLKICQELRETRARLIRIMGSSPNPELT